MELKNADTRHVGSADLLGSSVVPSSIIYSQTWITPDDATKMLDRFGDDTRNLATLTKNPMVIEYADVMANGGWIMNAQPLIFDTDGTLVDGFKRLAACVVSDTRFYTQVAKNVRKDTLHTVDQHRKRNYTGVLESRGEMNAGAIQILMSKLIRFENGLLGVEAFQISWSRFDIVFDANPKIKSAVEIATNFPRCNLHATARATLCFMALRANKEKELQSFLAEMTTATPGKVTAAGKISEQMQILRVNKTPYPVDVALALAIMAFNDFCLETVRNKPYKWSPKTPRGSDGDSSDTSEHLRLTSPNLGMPTVEGYLGLREGSYDIKATTTAQMTEETLKKLKEGAAGNEARPDIVTMRVTPELAEKWLTHNNDGNRKYQQSHIDMIARDITSGNWMVNAQPVSFKGDPLGADPTSANLLNGQHRLGAIVAAKMPVELPIATGIHPGAFLTYDKHAKKDQDMGLKGDFRAVRAAAKFQWRIDEGGDPLDRRTPSESELRATIDRHPTLENYFHEARKYKNFGSAGVMTFFLYHIFTRDAALSREFMQGMSDGLGLGKDNPIANARSPFVGPREKVDRRYHLGLLLKAWDDFLVYKRAS